MSRQKTFGVVAAGLLALAVISAVLTWRIVQQPVPVDAEHGSHEEPAHGTPKELADSGGIWFDGVYDAEDPAELKGNSANIFFATVNSVGSPEESPPQNPENEANPKGVTTQVLGVTLTEDAIKGAKLSGNTMNIRRLVAMDPTPAVGSEYMFFTSVDPDYNQQMVQAQPYGEKPVPDAATKDALRTTYQTTEGATPWVPGQVLEQHSDADGIQDSDNDERCTADAPEACEPGREP